MRWMQDAHDLWIDFDALAAARANRIEGTAGDDRLVGTGGRDRFDLSDGGDDRARGGDGNDSFDFGAAFTSADLVNGGEGRDAILIAGRYSRTVNLDPEHLRHVEVVKLGGNNTFDYNVTVEDGFSHLKVTGAFGGALIIDASRLMSGTVKLVGAGNIDTLIGGSGDDVIIGGSLGDTLTGGLGRDQFIYYSKFDSENTFFGRGGHNY